jgi:diguanylate cyclase (GGDEF)-like protein
MGSVSLDRSDLMRGPTRFPIAAKFAVILAVLVAALLAVGYTGLRGLSNLDNHVKGLQEHVVTLERTTAFATDTATAAKVAYQIIVSNSALEIAHLEDELGTVLVPSVNRDLEALRAAHAQDLPAERAKVAQESDAWARFLALRSAKPLDSAKADQSPGHDNALAAQLRAFFEPIERGAQQQTSVERSESADLAARAKASYHTSRDLVVLIAVIAIVLGGGVVALLIRAVVPRIRRYSNFALHVAGGEATNGVVVSGHDELSELGIALNEMVNKRVTERTREDLQAEFAEIMQLTETEEEAHQLLKHQVERLIPSSGVVMLSRNNSADRLEATTEVPTGSPLAGALESAKPRSCLAVRFARTHNEQLNSDPLISCEVCGKTAAFSTCEPLLVGGEVIGSILAAHPHPLSDSDSQSMKQSVTQAAPVLANLRNLAIAERRAETDALTGLPNNRNVTDTVRRMVAYASRSVSPLTALALDLDHFKHINDTFGHGSGDEVLAAVGSTLKSACRESDFVGRAGGEEFLILLPDTGLEGARLVAENVRAAIAAITVASVRTPITASIGVAVLPDHAGDATSLLRHADRALYTAKKNGRNRTEIFARDMLSIEATTNSGVGPSSDAASLPNGQASQETARAHH